MVVLDMESHVVAKNYTIWLENGIIYIEFEPDTVLSAKIAKQLIQHRNQIGFGLLLPVLINIESLKGLNHLTLLKFITDIDETSTIAKAIIGSSPKAKLIGDLIVRFSDNQLATKNFSSIIKAHRWIHNFQLYYPIRKSI